MKCVIGLDLGTKTLGISKSDLSQMIANAYTTINFRTDDYQTALKELTKIVKELDPEKLILGLPKNMDGSIGFQGEKTLEFKTLIEKEYHLEVVMIDERLTSKMAHNIMIEADLSRKKRKTKVDKLAATLILQSYLDSRK